MCAGKLKAGRPSRRVDAGEILEGSLDGLDGVPDPLAVELLAELDRPDANRTQRIQEAIEEAANG